MTKTDYKKYLIRIKGLMFQMGIEYVRTKSLEKNMSMFFPKELEIHYNVFSDKETHIYTLLHELGHAVESMLFPKLLSSKRIASAYQKVNQFKKTTKKELELVIMRETLAWKYAELLAYSMNIKITPSFFKLKEACLGEYADC